MGGRTSIFAGLALGLLLFGSSLAEAADYYVSAEKGKGKKGTKSKPVSNLGNLLGKIEAGDRIHMAGGVYSGKAEAGWVEFEVPVSIIGGYDESFSSRDPWGAHKTILVGINKSKNFTTRARLSIDIQKWNRGKSMEFMRNKKKVQYDVVIDGLIVDNGGRNRYKTEKKLKVLRKANPKTGENPTPDRAAIRVVAPIFGTATIQNCVVLNCGATGGAIAMWGSEGSKNVTRNNLVINNTGVGIFAHTTYQAGEDRDVTEHRVENNTVLFTEKYDAFGQINGHAFRFDPIVHLVARNNVFAFSDVAGVMNGNKSSLKKVDLIENLVTANLQADYVEFDTKLAVDAWEDDADELGDDSEGNEGGDLKVPVSATFLAHYFNRAIIDRNAAEADIKATHSKANALRGMLGLNLQAAAIDADSEVWLPLMQVDDALQAGMKPYRGKFGCSRPEVGASAGAADGSGDGDKHGKLRKVARGLGIMVKKAEVSEETRNKVLEAVKALLGELGN